MTAQEIANEIEIAADVWEDLSESQTRQLRSWVDELRADQGEPAELRTHQAIPLSEEIRTYPKMGTIGNFTLRGWADRVSALEARIERLQKVVDALDALSDAMAALSDDDHGP